MISMFIYLFYSRVCYVYIYISIYICTYTYIYIYIYICVRSSRNIHPYFMFYK
jgi:hypothetical protein